MACRQVGHLQQPMQEFQIAFLSGMDIGSPRMSDSYAEDSLENRLEVSRNLDIITHVQPSSTVNN